MPESSSAAPVEHRQDGHRAALTREILKSERQRARALAFVLSTVLALTLAIFLAP